ncbi:MAG: DUF2183 domain-containing protein [Gammaproteobacteria bacterium]|nr:DUF2183 domain-containing protein [Gammaproteobacteria bacterium]
MNKPELELVLFRGFCGSDVACVAGRVQLRSQLVPEFGAGGFRRRLKDAWRLVISRKVPRAEIELSFAGHDWQTATDSHGYFFSCHSANDVVADSSTRHHYRCRARHDICAEPITATGEVMTTDALAERLMISDIDDTIVHTGVANKLKMLWHLYFADSSARRPFPGMDRLLRRLHAGSSGSASNPMLYVSRSPWSIYPMLEAFFQQHDIPDGPVLLLRDWGISWRHPLPRRAEDHKQRMIDSAMRSFADLPIILIGDSGQHDPEVYADIAERDPARVQAIYIRDLGLSSARSKQLRAIGDRLARQGVEFVATSDTTGFTQHAEAKGWLSTAAPTPPDPMPGK